MTLKEYKSNIRKYRGHLASMDNQLEVIYVFGTDELKAFSLSNKAMGVQKMANIADSVSDEDQIEFVQWMHAAKRNKTSIDVKLLELI